MTQQRRDSHSTEFGLWVRDQTKLDSRFGFTTTNIDFLWANYTNDFKLLLEEKRYGYFPKKYQVELYQWLDRCCSVDPFYKGFHILIFENTSPDDGRIFLDGYLITNEDLNSFLAYEKDESWYVSCFPPPNVVKIADWNKVKTRE